VEDRLLGWKKQIKRKEGGISAKGGRSKTKGGKAKGFIAIGLRRAKRTPLGTMKSTFERGGKRKA